LNLMRKFAEACEAIEGTTKKLLKVGIVAEYLTSRSTEEASVSAVFFSGKPFPAWEETTLQVGERLLWRVVSELSGWSDAELTAVYRKSGGVGAVTGEALARATGARGNPVAALPELTVVEAENFFRRIADARGPAAKTVLVRELLSHAT